MLHHTRIAWHETSLHEPPLHGDAQFSIRHSVRHDFARPEQPDAREFFLELFRIEKHRQRPIRASIRLLVYLFTRLESYGVAFGVFHISFVLYVSSSVV